MDEKAYISAKMEAVFLLTAEQRRRPIRLYWLATSGDRVPVVAVCVLRGQLCIWCVTELAIL